MSTPPAISSAAATRQRERKAALEAGRALPKGAAADINGPSAEGAVIRFTMWTQFGAQAGVNVHHYKIAGAVPANMSWADIFVALFNNFKVAFPACFSNKATWMVDELREEIPVKSVTYTDAIIGGAGLLTDQPLPRQVTGLLRKITTEAKRNNTGRTYVPFPTVACFANEQSITVGYQGQLGAYGVAIDNDVSVGTPPNNVLLIPVVFHAKRMKPVPVAPYAVSVSNVEVINTSATQRRRGNYGRPNLVP
jgi:hypothetical protein